jgi:hypothetical protein
MRAGVSEGIDTMRRRFLALPGILLLLTWAPAVVAQSAEKIIERHVKAVGGAKALKSISSVRMTGSAARNGPGGGPGEFLWQTKAPGSFYLELRWGNSHSVEACNGKSARREDAEAGARTLSGREQARARATARYRNDHFLSYKKEKTKVQLAGRESVAGRAAYVVEMTTRNGLKRKLTFDAENSLLLKEEEEREGGREAIFFGDYRAVDGVKEPHRIRIQRGAELVELAVLEVKHNAGVDETAFDFPRKSSEPLPELATLLKAVEDNQKKLEEARENYTYNVAETNLEIDDKGNIKEKSEEVREVFYVHGRAVGKLVKKNGRELTGEEQRKEQERIVKRIAEIEKRHKEAEERKKKEQEKASPKKPKSEEDDDDVSISDFLRISQITNPRRERFRGKEVVVFEFSPRPGYKARNRAESVIQKLAGMIWVDEEAKEVVRLEAQITDAIRVGGGLVASVGKGSEFVFEQELVKNEVWLPRYSEVNLTARVLLVKGFKIHRIEQFSDYKKFNVETKQEIKPPAETKPPE